MVYVGVCKKDTSGRYWKQKWAGSGDNGGDENRLQVTKYEMNDSRLASTAVHCHVEDRRSKGRQQMRWIDNIREHVKAYTLGHEDSD